jgi:hypothetical protein
MNLKSSAPIDDDGLLTSEDERHIAFGEDQGKAGLTYGPFRKGGLSLRTFIERH